MDRFLNSVISKSFNFKIMENNSKELNTLLEQAKAFLDAKVEQLSDNIVVNSPIELSLNFEDFRAIEEESLKAIGLLIPMSFN